jgi:predicted DNA-binding transcriptional regulator YafY
VPVVAEAGKGYSLVEGYFLPPLSFSTDEATMLVLGGDLIAQHFDAQYRAAVQTATAKLEAVLSDKLRQEVSYLRESIALSCRRHCRAKKQHRCCPCCAARLSSGGRCAFTITTRRARDGEPARKWREADPYGMYHYGDAWYLMAFCHLRQESRSFRLDRLSQLKLLEHTFERPAGFFDGAAEDTARQVIVRVLFDEEAAPWVRESRAYYVNAMEERPDGLLVTLHVHAERELMQWLLYWGSHARVLEPQGLREALAEEGRKIFEKYSD